MHKAFKGQGVPDRKYYFMYIFSLQWAHLKLLTVIEHVLVS